VGNFNLREAQNLVEGRSHSFVLLFLAFASFVILNSNRKSRRSSVLAIVPASSSHTLDVGTDKGILR
jgi:hypothetical protein